MNQQKEKPLSFIQKSFNAFFDIMRGIGDVLSDSKPLRRIDTDFALSKNDMVPIIKGLFCWWNRDFGDSISKYEKDFAAIIDVPYAASFYAGRVALDAILYALGIQDGDEVILPGYTCVAVPNPVIFRGARPIYVDIDPATCNISPEETRKVISKRTKAIIVQHTYGIPADLDALIDISEKFNIPLIEDCTHALGNFYKGKRLGSLGKAAFFSSEQTKIISTGMGGVAVTGDSEIAERINEYKKQCIMPENSAIRRSMGFLLFQLLFLNPSLWRIGILFEYYFRKTGLIMPPITTIQEFNCQEPPQFQKLLSNAHARVGISQLKKLGQNLQRRKEIVKIYCDHVPQLGFNSLWTNSNTCQAMARYPIRTKRKYDLYKYYKKNNIIIGLWFCAPVHPAQVPQGLAGYMRGACPLAEKATDEVVNLPCHPNLSDDDVWKILSILKSF